MGFSSENSKLLKVSLERTRRWIVGVLMVRQVIAYTRMLRV
jgi:hypothetical protein